MRVLLLTVIVAVALTGFNLALVDCKSMKLRYKRQVEREDSPDSEVIIVKDKNGPLPGNTRYDLIPRDPNCTCTEEVDFDIDEHDGRFAFGGRIPDFQNFHGSFHDVFDILNQRFEQMMRRVAFSFRDHFAAMEPNLSSPESTSIDELPNNYNDTQTDIVEIDGQRFIKTKKVIKKGGPGASIFITSVSYKPVDESENEEPGSVVGPAGNSNADSVETEASSVRPPTPSPA